MRVEVVILPKCREDILRILHGQARPHPNRLIDVVNWTDMLLESVVEKLQSQPPTNLAESTHSYWWEFSQSLWLQLSSRVSKRLLRTVRTISVLGISAVPPPTSETPQ